MGAAGSWAAQRLVVRQVQLVGPMGTDTGHVIVTDNNFIFVDDSNPDGSFTVPKSDIRAVNLTGDVMTLNLSQPFSDMYSNRSDMALRFRNPEDPRMIADWVGMPLEGSAVVGRSRTELVPVTVTEFDVVHAGDNGRLLVGANRIEWQDLKNTSKSRSWSYSEIKSFKREGNELKIKPYSGDGFEFKVAGRMMSDDIYNAIADRIVAAHR
jgi:hypothetical protein